MKASHLAAVLLCLGVLALGQTPQVGDYRLERVINTDGATQVTWFRPEAGKGWMFGPDGVPMAFARPITIATELTTAANGTLTWTFPGGTFSAAPAIQLSVKDTSGGATVFNHVVTACDANSCTIKVTRSTPVTVATISVLGVSSAAATTVYLTATAKTG